MHGWTALAFLPTWLSQIYVVSDELLFCYASRLGFCAFKQ
jgi:hypothetical protein